MKTGRAAIASNKSVKQSSNPSLSHKDGFYMEQKFRCMDMELYW